MSTQELLSELQIRRLSQSDLPAVMEIERVSFSTPWKEVTFQGLLGRSDSDLFAATRFGQLVGYCVSWTVGDQSEVGNVAVAPRERGRGTAKRLIETALTRLRERGSMECFLEVRESNYTARSLYEKCGFESIGRRRNYYSRPLEDALVMRRILV